MASDDGKPRQQKRRKREHYSSSDESSSSSSAAESTRRHRRHRKDRKRRKMRKHKKKRHRRKHEYLSSSDDEYSYDKSRNSKRKRRLSRERSEDEFRDSTQGTETNHHVAVVEDANKKVEAIMPPSLPKEQKQVSQRARSMIPMSREQYEAQQAVVREVYDEETGRMRLIRGSGEIIERIVSKSDHERINQQATRGDGSSYARHIFSATQSKSTLL